MEISYELRTDNTITVRQRFGNGDQSWRVYDFNGRVISTSKKASFLVEFDESIEKDVLSAIKNFHQAPNYEAFLRFKNIPKSEHSINHTTGLLEDGVSVYGLDWDIFTGAWDVEDCDNPFQYFLNLQRGDEVTAYIVTGKRVGTGSDGEPLLRGVKILGKAMQKNGKWMVK